MYNGARSLALLRPGVRALELPDGGMEYPFAAAAYDVTFAEWVSNVVPATAS